ncbi:Os07g0604500 [Oryza sativa Japonica Group]|uniref:Os07g0604500 protein n=2 Tax=Oryza sativa subsp. japonica TaxID=39947 RepID=B9FYB0_ORYSJ|nr:hypothetical protein OsJ_25039 [Oryza sativa Japonica Group]KAB8106275.1 hypothetical protein EE612_040535 [Oryza sativa]BAT02552.1 Os07g0604500 [Oryza sativa Japonica Group]
MHMLVLYAFNFVVAPVTHHPQITVHEPCSELCLLHRIAGWLSALKLRQRFWVVWKKKLHQSEMECLFDELMRAHDLFLGL